MPPEEEKNKIKLPQLPFLTREMLAFGNQAKIEIEIDFFGGNSNDLILRGLTRDTTFEYRITPFNDTTRETFTRGLPDIPILLSIVNADNFTLQRGDTFVYVYLKINGVRVYNLGAGYLTDEGGFSWPLSHKENSLRDGGRFIRTSLIASTGTEITNTIPENVRALIKSIRLPFTTDANAANRRVHLQFRDTNDVVLYEVASSVDHPANTTRTYIFSPIPSVGDFEVGSTIFVPIPPDVWLLEDMDIHTETDSSQAGDDFGTGTLLYEAYRESLP